ncbi:hypothetical protein HDU89_006481 [Geranomyces variabilis]|nr:hypothetical protein HDU89_006481 [Geranomyces variabilis]
MPEWNYPFCPREDDFLYPLSDFERADTPDTDFWLPEGDSLDNSWQPEGWDSTAHAAVDDTVAMVGVENAELKPEATKLIAKLMVENADLKRATVESAELEELRDQISLAAAYTTVDDTITKLKAANAQLIRVAAESAELALLKEDFSIPAAVDCATHDCTIRTLAAKSAQLERAAAESADLEQLKESPPCTIYNTIAKLEAENAQLNRAVAKLTELAQLREQTNACCQKEIKALRAEKTVLEIQREGLDPQRLVTEKERREKKTAEKVFDALVAQHGKFNGREVTRYLREFDEAMSDKDVPEHLRVVFFEKICAYGYKRAAHGSAAYEARDWPVLKADLKKRFQSEDSERADQRSFVAWLGRSNKESRRCRALELLRTFETKWDEFPAAAQAKLLAVYTKTELFFQAAHLDLLEELIYELTDHEGNLTDDWNETTRAASAIEKRHRDRERLMVGPDEFPIFTPATKFGITHNNAQQAATDDSARQMTMHDLKRRLDEQDKDMREIKAAIAALHAAVMKRTAVGGNPVGNVTPSPEAARVRPAASPATRSITRPQTVPYFTTGALPMKPMRTRTP